MSKEPVNELKDNVILESILRSSTDMAIAATDLDFRILYYNPAAEKLFGYTAEEMIGKTVMEIHTREKVDPSSFDKVIEAVLKEGEYQYILEQKKDGGICFIESRVSGIRDKQNRLIGFVLMSRDITERKQSEEESQRTIKELWNLKSIINRSPAMAFLWPVQEGWPVEFVTENVKNVLGYTADDFISGKVSWPGITYKEDIPRLEAEVTGYLEKGITEFSQEYRLITKSGDVRWMRDQNKVIHDLNGTATHIQSIVRDISERKKAEVEALLHSEIITNMAEGVNLVRSGDGLIVYTNAKFEEMFGYGHNELIGKDISVINAPVEKSPGETVNEIMDALNKKRMWEGEVHNIKKDGTLFWCHASVSAFDHFEHGRVFLSVHTDITELKKAGEKLKESERYLIEAQAIAHIGHWKLNPETEEVSGSDELFRIFGISREEAFFEAFASAVHPDDREDALHYVRRGIELGEPWDTETRLILKDGTEKTVHAKSETIRSEQGQILLMGTVQDITERKKVEKVLKNARDELELRVKERTAELESTVRLLQEEISERKKIENELQEKEKLLTGQAIELTESNAALKVLLRQREEDRKEIENNILSNIKHLVQPYIQKLKKNKSASDEFMYLKILESNLEEIVSPFSSKLSSKHFGFSPRELQVANLIKDGKQDKDIMEILNISLETIKIHRKNIRKKLGITREKINLRTRLLSLDK